MALDRDILEKEFLAEYEKKPALDKEAQAERVETPELLATERVEADGAAADHAGAVSRLAAEGHFQTPEEKHTKPVDEQDEEEEEAPATAAEEEAPVMAESQDGEKDKKGGGGERHAGTVALAAIAAGFEQDAQAHASGPQAEAAPQKAASRVEETKDAPSRAKPRQHYIDADSGVELGEIKGSVAIGAKVALQGKTYVAIGQSEEGVLVRAEAAKEKGDEKSSGGAGSDEFQGTHHQREKPPVLVPYGKGKNRTYGWDIGGSKGVVSGGGVMSNAIYATSRVEGGYDSVQTYDTGVLSFGILQWTLHASSLMHFLEHLKSHSGKEGREAFEQYFSANGIDVRGDALLYEGKAYQGAKQVDELVRVNQKTALQWARWFTMAGKDERVARAEFEFAKQQYRRWMGQTIERYAKYARKAWKYEPQNPGKYGSPAFWTSGSPTAAALFFSMTTNNPGSSYVGLVKAIDQFYAQAGTDQSKWPKNWPDQFTAIYQEVLSTKMIKTWGGRMKKTLANLPQAGRGAGVADLQAPVTTPKPPQTTPPSTAPHKEPEASTLQKIEAYAKMLARKASMGLMSTWEAAKELLHFSGTIEGKGKGHPPSDHAQKLAEQLRTLKGKGPKGSTRSQALHGPS